MCLAIPAEIVALEPDGCTALAEVLGLRRPINTMLLEGAPVQAGDWVLVHVGFAMNRIDADRAREQLALLERLGAAAEARRELDSEPPPEAAP